MLLRLPRRSPPEQSMAMALSVLRSLVSALPAGCAGVSSPRSCFHHMLLPVSPIAPLPIPGRSLTPVQPPPLLCSPPCLLKPWCRELGAGAGQVTAASGQALLHDTGSSYFLICSK